MLLSGVSAWLSLERQGGSNANAASEQRRFLLTRGLWLIFLEFTIVNFGIWFDIQFRILLSQVIAAIGFGLVALSFLVRIKPRVIGIIGLTIICTHNLLQNVTFPVGTLPHYVWGALFKLSLFQISPNFILLVNYPLIPWLGILLTGFGFGRYMTLPDGERRTILFRIGAGALVLFVLLRTFNLYGDPVHWTHVQKNALFAFLSFINVSKYPPSLLFVCATLGKSLLIMACADFFAKGRESRFTRVVAVYGKVPLFYYILHWYVAHSLMLALMLWQGFRWADLNFAAFGFGRPKQGGGVELFGVYIVWACVVAALYPLCAWYGRYKTAHPEKSWLRYL